MQKGGHFIKTFQANIQYNARKTPITQIELFPTKLTRRESQRERQALSYRACFHSFCLVISKGALLLNLVVYYFDLSFDMGVIIGREGGRGASEDTVEKVE